MISTTEDTTFDKLLDKLSSEAKTLLKAASLDETGAIVHIPHSVQTKGKNFITDNKPRTEAIWSDAVDELVKFGLIKDKGHKREVFMVTRKGYDLADLIT